MSVATHAALIFVVGPTAVGKTAVALILARRIGAEILSIDSRQAYRHLDIGTAKPTPEQRAAAAHHLLDLFDPREAASAEEFARRYREALHGIRTRGKAALAVGGSGLYVDACLGRLDALPPADAQIRAAHERIRDAEGAEALHRRLAQADPATAARLAPRDFQRVSRALEVQALTGRPLSRLQTRGGGRMDLSAGPPMLLLSRERSDLDQRIHERAQAMIDAGLLDEVTRLLAAGVPASSCALEAIGYTEFARALAGEVTMESALEGFLQRTRRYARRQMAWFRNRYAGVREVSVSRDEEPEETAGRILRLLGEA
ncbi:MAG: tRNA (adenosine(37)-N6)-dimethylallyltransferase MiaA [Candidatus Eisenbacteria bacterium]